MTSKTTYDHDCTRLTSGEERLLRAIVLYGDQRRAAHELGIAYSTLKTRLLWLREKHDLNRETMPRMLVHLHNAGHLDMDTLEMLSTAGRRIL